MENSTNIETQKTFGEQLVGLNFIPSEDDVVGSKVAHAKKLFADAADLLHQEYLSKANEPFFNELYSHTIGEILNAQMNVVKVLTLKY